MHLESHFSTLYTGTITLTLQELFPCIVLYETATDIPIHYTGLERYLCHLAKSQMLDGKTLEARAYAVCHFLNYLLWETDIRSLHECTLDTIRDFLKSSRRGGI